MSPLLRYRNLYYQALVPLAMLSIVTFASPVWASEAQVLGTVATEFIQAIKPWQRIILEHASWLFWALATISFTWTFGMKVLQRADIQEFFAEFLKFSLSLGFFYWLLIQGPDIAKAVIDSFISIGSEVNDSVSISFNMMNLGYVLFEDLIYGISARKVATSFITCLIAIIVLILFAVVSANLIIEYCCAWFLLYVGCLFLGFGSSKWTSDITINYLKSVVGSGIRIMTVTILIGILFSITNQLIQGVTHTITVYKSASILVLTVIMFVLIQRLPSLLAGLVGGGAGQGGLITLMSMVGAAQFAWQSGHLAVHAAKSAGSAMTGASTPSPSSAASNLAGLGTGAFTGASAEAAKMNNPYSRGGTPVPPNDPRYSGVR